MARFFFAFGEDISGNWKHGHLNSERSSVMVCCALRLGDVNEDLVFWSNWGCSVRDRVDPVAIASAQHIDAGRWSARRGL